MKNINGVLNEIGIKIEFLNSPEWKIEREQKRIQLDKKAMNYLHMKFPEIPDEVFFTDRSGMIHEHIDIVDALDICSAFEIENTCAKCKSNVCQLPENFQGKNSRPVVVIEESPRGFKYLGLRWIVGNICKNDPLSGNFGQLFKRSGLFENQLSQTFENFKRDGVSAEVVKAKTFAMMAAKNSSSLILAGKPGSGKTHLATAIAIENMKQGKQSIFRLINEISDELRNANIESSEEYSEFMNIFKQVPCLVLDDLGKARTTDAGLDYLYQIIDYRYRRNFQTILTTNALSPEELSNWERAEYIMPIVSRIVGNGTWVTIKNAEDFRFKKAVNQ